MSMDSSAVAVLIPAYNPSRALLTLVDEVHQLRFASAIIVVNDGSRADCDPIFTSLQSVEHTIVLSHSNNRGKGAALKSGFDYVRRHLPHVACVVTADADGQHAPASIRDVANRWLLDHEAVVLGSRVLTASAPLRSRIGNAATAAAVRLLLGLNLRDTQTGLRAIPARYLSSLLGIGLNHYEFEMEMLLMCKRQRIPIRQVPIETIYIDGNVGSHFNPIVDSIKIYFVLVRYVIASIFTTAVDFLVFTIASGHLSSVMALTYVSRGVAATVNYAMVRSLVFHSRENVARTFPKYLALVGVSGFLSGALVTYFVTVYRINIIVAKIVAELTLYAATFLVQRNVIFGVAEKE